MDSFSGNTLFYPQLIRLEEIIAGRPVFRDWMFNICRRALGRDRRLQGCVKGQGTELKQPGDKVAFRSQQTWSQLDFKPVGHQPGVTEEHLSAQPGALGLHVAQSFRVFCSSEIATKHK